MAVAWTQTRENLADAALRKCGVLGAEQTPASADRQLALDALDGLLKSLPLYGLVWPEMVQTTSAISYTAGTAQMPMPADWFGGAFSANLIDPVTGKESPLAIGDLTWYDGLADKSTQAARIQVVFADQNRVLRVYPVPNVTQGLKLWYQSVTEDSVAATAPLRAEWMLGLIYGIAANIGDEFGVAPASMQRFELKWLEARSRALISMSAHLPVIVTVAD